MRMLLLEDDERVARGVVRITTTLGHEAVHTKTVQEAQTALRAHVFDLILADLGLGSGESGIDLLAWARKECPQVRRVLTSGALRPTDYALEPPQQSFLHKPFGRKELVELLGESAPRGGVS